MIFPENRIPLFGIMLDQARWRKLEGGTHTHANLDKDVSGKNVLISRHFYYFGRNAVELPERLKLVAQGGQGHRSRFPATYIGMLEEWLTNGHRPGIHGTPDSLTLEDCTGHKAPKPSGG